MKGYNLRYISMVSVLVVDDEELIRVNLVAYLEDEEAEAVGTSSGEDALIILAEREFDVAIIDMRLPGMNGNELIIRANQCWPDMGFVIHTGSTEYRLPQGLSDIGLEESHVFLKPMQDMGEITQLVCQLAKRLPKK